MSPKEVKAELSPDVFDISKEGELTIKDKEIWEMLSKASQEARREERPLRDSATITVKW